jgi:hypothetical protein
MYSLTLIPPCRGLPPRTPPWLFLPLVGRAKSLASPSALSLGPAPAMADGVTDLRLSAWSLVPLVTLILAEVHSR